MLSLRRFTSRMANKLNEYRIAFRGLGEGKHLFEFVLDSAFFDCFDTTNEMQGDVGAIVEIVKSSLLIEVKISVKGIVKVACDRCLGEIAMNVEGEMNLYVKQSDREEGNDDDYMIVSSNDDYLDLSSYLYEVYILNYPMRAIHPDGECDEEMKETLSEYIKEENDKPTDPRWDELKKLINN